MREISPSRGKAGIGIAVFFLVATAALYGFFSSEIDAEIEMVDKITANDSSMYEGFTYSVENSENSSLEPVLYAVGPRQRGEVKLQTNSTVLAQGEKSNITGFLDEKRGLIPPAGDYMLIIKDRETGRFDSRIVSFDNEYLSEKNPYFVKTSGYRSHWTGSIYGNGDYNMSMVNKGLNASFRNCSNVCGFTYRDNYRLNERLVVSGKYEGLGEETELKAVVNDKEFDISLDNRNGTQYFERKVNLTEEFGSTRSEETVYELAFRSHQKDFHWIQINQYRFYNPE